MSISRQILADQLNPERGFQAKPTDVQDTNPSVIEADDRNTKKDRGHMDLGQVIRKGLELRTRSHTSKYQTTGELAPGDLGSYVIRAENSALSISLGKPPAVPEDQRTPLGNSRERTWTVEMAIYYAVACDLTWPSNVVFGRFGYEIQDSEGVFSLVEVPGPAPNPRAILTTDVYRLTYIERTGQWIAEAVALGIQGNDPLNPDPDATEEQPDADPWEPGDGTDPDLEYTDPDGNPMEPEKPISRSGGLLAFHDGSISKTTDGGATWRVRTGTPTAPSSVSSVPGRGVMLVSGGQAYYSDNAENWMPISLSEDIVVESSLENGDFETGDLTGWTTTAGDSPRVLDSNSPPQQPGSDYYLARDWRIFTNAEFELTQSISVPAGLGLPEARVSVDVFAEAHAQAGLRVGRDLTVPSTNPMPNLVNGRLPNFATSPAGAALDLVLVSGSPNGLVTKGVSGSSGTRVFELRFSIDDRLYPDPVLLSFDDIDANERIDIPNNLLLDTVVPDGSSVVASNPGANTRLSTTDNNQSAAAIFKSGRIEFYAQLNDSGIPLRGGENYPTSFSNGGTTIFDQQKGAWHTISTTFPAVPGEPFDLTLAATGSPADAYFDNVRVEFEAVKSKHVQLVAPGYTRHLIFTNSGVHELKSGVSRLGDIPFPPLHAAGTGQQIAIAAANDIAISEDNGATFSQFNHQHAFVQVLGRANLIVAVDGNGGVYSILPSGLSVLSRLDPGSRIAFDRKRGLWFAVAPSGSTFKSQLLQTWELQGTQPTNAAATDRRLVCPDFGRHFGYTEGQRDLYFSDKPMDRGVEGPADWKLATPLTLTFSHLIEVQ